MTTIQDALAQLTANPELHKSNHFAHDIVVKYKRYGSLTERQLSALFVSLQRDIDRASESTEPKGPAPSGKQTITGRVLSVKVKESLLYGPSLKMLLKLDNNSKVYVSVPKGANPAAGDTITITATFEVSDKDPSFAFGKRPTLGATGDTDSLTATIAESVLEEIKDTEPEPPAKLSILAQLLELEV